MQAPGARAPRRRDARRGGTAVTRSKLGRFAAPLAALLVLAPVAPALAQDETGAATPAGAEPAEEESWFSGLLQVDFTNAYYFNGILNEDQGFIAQPWLELYATLYSSDDGLIREVGVGGGVWNTFHENETLAENGPQELYETDWYPLLWVTFPGDVTLTTYYYFYTSPNGAFHTVEELNFELAWDDSETLGRWSMKPWINFAIETSGTSFGPDEGSAVQMGVEPTLYKFEHDDLPVTLSLPLELGLAIDDYYEEEDGSEDTYAYFSFGLTATAELAFLPESAGTWKVAVSGKGMHFNDALEDYNGEDLVGIWTASVIWEF
jgi:hypothetical protein